MQIILFGEDLLEFKIHNIGKATEKMKYAVCIIDQHSKQFNKIYVNYDKRQPVRKFKAEIYNSNGELVKKLKKSDIKDMRCCFWIFAIRRQQSSNGTFLHTTNTPTHLFMNMKRMLMDFYIIHHGISKVCQIYLSSTLNLKLLHRII